MKRLLTLAAALVLAGSAFAACSDSNDDNPAVDGGDATTTTAAASNTTTASGALTLTTSNFSFNPSTLVAAAGTITIELKNAASDTEHNLTIQDLKVDQDVEAGETETVSIANAQPGTYAFHCEYHPNSMLGTLTVS